MHQIDKEKFGTFLVQLRKEKGMTQKELAEKLYVSDKAVSKWERSLSLPDISLLQPMAELLGVSVTELLSGRYIQKDQTLTVEEVEPLVAGTLTMTVQEREAQREHRRRWGTRFLVSILACALEMWLFRKSAWMWGDWSVFSLMLPMMALGFGIHLIFFSKEKLPAFYDQYKVNFVSDGAFRMNMTGVYFNNKNWPHILNAMRTWACAALAGWLPLYHLVRWAASLVLPEGQAMTYVLLGFTLFGILGVLFIPVTVVGKKYE
ncbi:MAG: helix-turn-helix domain-containing protein [Oscillospiraceae bacterium]|nr:helix-turn-helix domain-containing protein [Oscillospiraceae bacterium]